MSALSVQPTFPIFTDVDGQPLEDGFIWIGQTNLPPQTNPITVYWDAALTITAAQPIRTIGGYPSNSGTPGRLYVNGNYSILVQNKNGATAYSAPAATERYDAGSISTIDSTQVVYQPAGTGAEPTTVQAKLRETVSVLDFGADPTGGTDSTAAIQAAINLLSGGGQIFFPSGTYKITSTIKPTANIELDGGFCTIDNQIPAAAGSPAASVFYVQYSGVSVRNFNIKNNPGINYGLVAADYVPVGYQGATISVTPIPQGQAFQAVDAEVTNVIVSNIKIENSVNGRFVVNLRGRVHNTIIENIDVKANGTTSLCYKVGVAVEHSGTAYRPRNTIVRNINLYGFQQVSTYTQYGFYLAGGIHTSVENVYLDNTVYAGVYMFNGEDGPDTMTETSITVRNAKFLNAQGDTFLIAGRADPAGAIEDTYFTIDNCFVQGDVTDLGATGIRCIKTGGELRISNMRIENIAVGADFTDCTNVKLSQLSFNNIIQNGTNPRAGKALILERCNGFEVDKCSFDAVDEEAIWLSESSFTSIRNNTFKDVYTESSTTSAEPAIQIRKGSTNNVIDSNVFGYQGQSVIPWRWVSIEDNGTLGIGIDRRNKIVNNNFYPSGGGAAILNGDLTSAYLILTVIENNTADDAVYVGAPPAYINGNNRVFYDVTAAPAAGTWSVGDRAIRVPVVGQPKAWSCTVAGTPGTWVSEGNL